MQYDIIIVKENIKHLNKKNIERHYTEDSKMLTKQELEIHINFFKEVISGLEIIISNNKDAISLEKNMVKTMTSIKYKALVVFFVIMSY